jgi:hypothetical protein
MLVYTTLAGRRPYEGLGIKSLRALVNNVIKGLRPAIPADLDPKWKDLIIECWQGDPNGRPDFEQICRQFGRLDFINGLTGSDQDRFLKYRKSVSPQDFGFS